MDSQRAGLGLAYLGVLASWGSTPLAIKWSGEGPGYLFGAAGRIVVGSLLALLVCRLIGVRIRLDRAVWPAYLVAAGGIYLTTLSLYWGAQQIPSGWVSVLLGVTPLVSALAARRWLGEPLGGPIGLSAMALAIGGVAVIFSRGGELSALGGYGVAAVLLATLSHATTMVWIKRLDQGVPILALVTVALWLAAPPLAATWLAVDGHWPAELSPRALGAILYAALIGTVTGLALYLHVLRHLGPTRVALITLITPLWALMLGHWLDGEVIDRVVWIGTAMVLGGLLLFEAAARERPPPRA